MNRFSVAAMVAATCLFGVQVQAKDIKPQNAQAALLAGMMVGMCDASTQRASTVVGLGLGTEVKSPTSEMSFEEKRRCAYVKNGLKQDCFMNGSCPSYEDWSKTYLPGIADK